MLNETAVIEGIRQVHHALSACVHDDLDGAENSLRLAIANLLECVDEATRFALVKEYADEVGIQEGDGYLHQIETDSGPVMLLPDGLWWEFADDNHDPLKPVVPVDSEQYRRSDERTQVVLRAIADHQERLRKYQ